MMTRTSARGGSSLPHWYKEAGHKTVDGYDRISTEMAR